MLYKDLKKWFVDWLNENPEPVPLNVGNYMLSPDIRTKVKNDLERIDTILKIEGKATQRARVLLEHLKTIKTAIENKSHDISDHGWTVFDKWIENGQDQEN